MTDRGDGSRPIPRPDADRVDAAIREALAALMAQASSPAERALVERLAAAIERLHGLGTASDEPDAG